MIVFLGNVCVWEVEHQRDSSCASLRRTYVSTYVRIARVCDVRTYVYSGLRTFLGHVRTYVLT